MSLRALLPLKKWFQYLTVTLSLQLELSVPTPWVWESLLNLVDNILSPCDIRLGNDTEECHVREN